MKQLRFIFVLAIPLSLTAIASAQAPVPAPSPIKMGLWHEEVTTTITGVEDVVPAPQKDSEQFCISAESWHKHALQAANSRCIVSNLHQDAHGVSYDVSCGSSEPASTVFHMNILIDNDRRMHGTAVATITAPGSPHHGTWTSTITERYVAPGCGSLKPGEKKHAEQ